MKHLETRTRLFNGTEHLANQWLHFSPLFCTFLHCTSKTVWRKRVITKIFNEIKDLESFRTIFDDQNSFKMKHLQHLVKVMLEGSGMAKIFDLKQTHIKKAPQEGALSLGVGSAGTDQSPNIFCLSSRRC
jgi:hypothetical protein